MKDANTMIKMEIFWISRCLLVMVSANVHSTIKNGKKNPENHNTVWT